MAKAKIKPRPKKKSAPKKKATLEDVLGEIKRIHQRLDKIESDIRAPRGVTRSQAPLEEATDTDIETKFGFLTSL
jgi:hypothetical protein